MGDDQKRETAGASITAPLIETAGMIVTPLRAAALIALGGTALMADAARRRVSHAADEGERQLELFSESFRRRTARFWRRRGPHSAASSGRSSRTSAAS
jgi:hypothetical protein